MSNAQVAAHLKKFGLEQRKILTDVRNHIASKIPNSEQVIKCDQVLSKMVNKAEPGLPMTQRERSTKKLSSRSHKVVLSLRMR